MAQFPDITWHQLRGKAPSGSQRDGFEELSSQLMIFGNLVVWPAGTRFSTFGNPDGGREGRGELPNGAVWAWQAKYLFKLDSEELQQISESVDRVLENEPTLERYFVLLPYNPPAGDTTTAKKTTKSAWTKWNDAVAKWEAKAQAKGLTVVFEYIGETQLNSCLLAPSQAGRLRYWFDLEVFTADRFRAIAARAEADAGGRYTPELNVDLPIAAVFDGLARTQAFEHDIRLALAGLRKAQGIYGLWIPEQRPDLFEPAIAVLQGHLKELEAALENAVVQAHRPDGVLPDPAPEVDAIWASLNSLTELLDQHCLQGDHYSNNASNLKHQISALQAAIGVVSDLRTARAWRSSGQNAVLIHGTGGAGKTHLLCDLAKSRTEQGLPTIVVLGEHFERGPIETDLGRIIGFANPADQLLATFDAACQAAGVVGLIIVDGVNEATDRAMWNKYLNSFLNEVGKFRHIRLVISCRTEFLDDTLSEDLLKRLHHVRHTGFEEVSREAIDMFLDWYDIERPSFPMLDPEFTNPLFLKLLCTTLQTRNEHRFPRDGIGTSWVFNSFLDATNERLAGSQRCDYIRHSPLVRQAVEQIAAAMHTRGRRLPWQDVEQITTSLLPGRGFSQGLLNGLLKEAILSDLRAEDATYIRFGYERLGDIALAQLIAADDPDTLAERIAPMAERWYRNAGVLQALASVLPEVHGTELIDVLAIPTSEYHRHAHTDFLLSLAWRRPEAVTDRTEQILVELQATADFADEANNALLQVATVGEHRLNADWLHQHLAGLTLPERDATWTQFCDWQDEIGGHLPALINWAWSDASGTAIDDTRRLAALTLTWALASSHRPTRDNATKAIIALLEPAPHLYRNILLRFAAAGDDSIEERLLAVGCGLAQRTRDPQVAAAVAETVRDYTGGRGYWPQNYLSRDYARRVIDAATGHGWQPGPIDLAASVRPPYMTVWIDPERSREQIEELSGGPDYRYSAVSHPLMSDFDDFRNHLLEPLIGKFQLEGTVDTDHLGRILFDQVLHLGWTPERFATMERNLRQARAGEGKHHEGIAQKYVWIAFKQLVGRMTDRFPLNPSNRDDQRTDYQTPLDVYGHDIDPTVLLRRTENRVYADTPPTWFAPVPATFPAGVDDTWATHDEHGPPAGELLVSADENGDRWFVLEGHYKWSQVQHPEEAAVDAPHHSTWMQIRSYLIDTSSIEAWRSWVKGQDWHGRWMPESGSPTGLLLADHPYKWGWPDLDPRDRSSYRDEPPPGELIVTTARYGGVANDWDQSDSRHLFTYMPSTALCAMLDLDRLGDFEWGRDGTLLAAGFAARTPGPDSTHVTVQTLREKLTTHGKAVLWTMLGAKETSLPDHQLPRDGRPLLRSYSASYLFDGTHVQLLDANARTLYAGRPESDPATWSLPSDIPL